MAIKKSELYSSLWQSCDELRGGMDSSQYKDYVLVLLFIKYISDKYAGQVFSPVTIPDGASFKDMVALKGKTTIGDDINKKIIAPLKDANKLSSMPDFNDPEKLGSGKEMVDKLTSLIAIFENKALDFSNNRAEHDDILGDAFEYLMSHFATESGKSKGQFYTPSEVSRIIAKIIGIKSDHTKSETTVYDPTCGSSSLLLKVADEARTKVSLFGQEKDASTSGLARMNMILHKNADAEIKQSNTLANPLFKNEQGQLRTFDYVVANPPFSDKRWSNGVDTENDPHQRFEHFGTPPDKNGDYAYLLHIIRSLKSQGKGACILPHGVLFRGNAEAGIRKALIRKGLIKGIIGLPANLFFGTGIPACIILIDKANAQNRQGIFMVDAGKGFIKDGNKNRLREMDIHKIVDVFNKQMEIPGYSRMISTHEIEKNDFNLNIPRYIDSSETEDLQDIKAHLLGGIPQVDIDALQAYWQHFPKLKTTLLKPSERENFVKLQVEIQDIKQTIFTHSEFSQFIELMNQAFTHWQQQTIATLKALEKGFHPKELIQTISENLLLAYTDKPLLNKYDVYQHLMNYWAELMQDDCYLITAEGWVAETYRIIGINKKGNEVDKGWTCDLIPKVLLINRYFVEEQQAIDQLNTKLENLQAELAELEEQHAEGALSDVGNQKDANSVEAETIDLAWSKFDSDAYQTYLSDTQNLDEQIVQFADLKEANVLQALKNGKGNITKKAVKDRLKIVSGAEEETLTQYIEVEETVKLTKNKLKDLRATALAYINECIDNHQQQEYIDEIITLRQYLQLTQQIADTKKIIKEAETELDNKLLKYYPTLTIDQIKQLVIDDKWMVSIEQAIQTEMDRLSQKLTQRIKELAERYQTPMPQINQQILTLEQTVNDHLAKMGFSI